MVYVGRGPQNAPKGKDRLPSTNFQGLTVSFREGRFITDDHCINHWDFNLFQNNPGIKESSPRFLLGEGLG